MGDSWKIKLVITKLKGQVYFMREKKTYNYIYTNLII